jgi:hypothetical protein
MNLQPEVGFSYLENGKTIFALLGLALAMIAAGLATKTRPLYWAATGAILGLGLITIFSVGLPLLLLAAGLVLFGFKCLGPSRFWVTPVSMGAVPALVLVYDYFTADRSTVWFPDGYLAVAAVFAAISAAGAILGLLEIRRHKTDTG